MTPVKKRFKKPCKDCKIDFRPTGKFGRYCDKCLKKPRHINGRKLWVKPDEKSK